MSFHSNMVSKRRASSLSSNNVVGVRDSSYNAAVSFFQNEHNELMGQACDWLVSDPTKDGSDKRKLVSLLKRCQKNSTVLMNTKPKNLPTLPMSGTNNTSAKFHGKQPSLVPRKLSPTIAGVSGSKLPPSLRQSPNPINNTGSTLSAKAPPKSALNFLAALNSKQNKKNDGGQKSSFPPLPQSPARRSNSNGGLHRTIHNKRKAPLPSAPSLNTNNTRTKILRKSSSLPTSSQTASSSSLTSISSSVATSTASTGVPTNTNNNATAPTTTNPFNIIDSVTTPSIIASVVSSYQKKVKEEALNNNKKIGMKRTFQVGDEVIAFHQGALQEGIVQHVELTSIKNNNDSNTKPLRRSTRVNPSNAANASKEQLITTYTIEFSNGNIESNIASDLVSPAGPDDEDDDEDF